MLQALLFEKHIEKDEHIKCVVHKHWMIGTKSLFWPSISFLAAWFVLYLKPTRFIFYIVALWAIVSLVIWFRNFFDYYLDTWIITDHGVIDLEWKGWFHRESARVLYSDIQGVSYEINGISATLMGYGTVTIEKISTGAALSLPYVPNPRSVETQILNGMEHYLHDKNLKNAKHVQELLAEFVSQKVQMDQVKEKNFRKTF